MAGAGPVLVTGGTGTLGRAVVAEVTARGLSARVLSRRPGAHSSVGDLATGAGLPEAVAGARAVIHCATDARHARSVDVEGTGRLLAALGAAEPGGHLVHVSIVGCDASPLAYYRVKAEAERVVLAARDGGAPASVVRATQFHELLLALARRANLGPVAVGVRGLRFQPCDTRYVARQLVDVALGRPLAERREVAGPQLLAFAAAVRAVAGHDGRRVPRVVTLPAVGGSLRAIAAGSNLPGPRAVVGGATFAGWLAER